PGIRPVPLVATPPVAPAAPTETSAAEAPLAHDAESDDLLADDLAQTIIKPRQVAVDDDLEATVVVARKRGVRRSLVLDDGRSFALSGASVVIGRNPVGDPGEQRLSITDATRTLSKTHARLVVTDDEWRLTDLHATNGVVVVAEDGTEVLLDPGESVVGTGRFILGEVGMHVIAERDS
ncbi:MAG: FHA domain-containing protein, partial [Microbacterium sp.]|nr:FHA domain-containing protein [Microbacterium sp.]